MAPAAFGEEAKRPACQNYEFQFIQLTGGYSCAPIPESGIVPKCGNHPPMQNSDGTYGCRESKQHDVIIEPCASNQHSVFIDKTHFGCANN